MRYVVLAILAPALLLLFLVAVIKEFIDFIWKELLHLSESILDKLRL